MLNINFLDLDFYIDKIRNRENFSLSRWGDGEWFCTVGVNGQNCDNHRYLPELRDGLVNALKNNKSYYKAIWGPNHGQIKRILHIILPFIHKNNINNQWVNAGIWEDAVLKDGIDRLVESLESRNLVIVSNHTLRDLNIKYVDYVEVPKVNCYNDKDRIKSEMISITKKYKDVVFAMSSSMATNVIIDELYDEIGDKCSMIDFGSIWDPFVGRHTRSYHRQYIKTKL